MKKKPHIISFSVAFFIILTTTFCFITIREDLYSYSQLFNRSEPIETAYTFFKINYLNTDREVYYLDESIKINASWDKEQIPDDPPNEESFFQIQILNYSYDILWNSSRFYENGDDIEKNFTLSIENDLDLIIEGQSIYLTVCLFYFCSDPPIEGHYNNKTIKILREGNFSIAELNFNRNIFYPDEFLEINMTYGLLYDLEYETSYIEFRLFNTTNELLWNSSKFYQEGVNIEKNLTIPVQSFINYDFNSSLSLKITIYYYYKSLISSIEKQGYFCNTTIEIIKKGLFNAIKLDLNKEFFYPDENIEIVASWELLYNPVYENCFVQIKIFNSLNNLIWNSSKFYDRNICEKNFNLKISKLNISNNNLYDSYYIYIDYYFNSSIITFEITESYLNTSFIIYKKNNLLPFMFNFNKISKEIKTTNYSIIILLISVLPFTSIIVILLLTKKRKILEDMTIEY